MKKSVLIVVLFLSVSLSHASGLSDEKSKVWRSSEICGTFSESVLSTVPAYAFMLQVTSGSASVSQFVYVNTTGTVASGASRSTSTVYDVSSASNRWELHRELSGLSFQKIGISCISLLWDFLVPAPAGQSGRGLGR